MAEQLQVRIVCAADLMGSNKVCAEAGVWFADLPEVREILRQKAAAANGRCGAGTHWLETRNTAAPPESPPGSGRQVGFDPSGLHGAIKPTS